MTKTKLMRGGVRISRGRVAGIVAGIVSGAFLGGLTNELGPLIALGIGLGTFTTVTGAAEIIRVLQAWGNRNPDRRDEVNEFISNIDMMEPIYELGTKLIDSGDTLGYMNWVDRLRRFPGMSDRFRTGLSRIILENPDGSLSFGIRTPIEMAAERRLRGEPETPVETPVETTTRTNPLRVTTVPVEPSDTAIEIENPMRIGTGATSSTLTNRLKFLKKHGLPADTSLSMKEMAKLSGFPIQALNAVKRRGVGAWKTSIGSVRMKDGSKNPSAPRTSKMSKEQWSLGRVFAFLMKTKKVFYGADNDIREKYNLS